jgi:carboxymethylenebutenolidase
MRAGEAPDASPANKAAREQGFTRLVTLIKEMKPAPTASNSTQNKTVATKKSPPTTAATQCHDSSMAMAGSM